MTLPLEGKVALITGSAKGIGRGIAHVLAEHGADIILNDLEPGPDIEHVKREIAAYGRKVLIAPGDVGQEESVDNIFRHIEQSFGKVDILVNNAGTSKAQDIFSTTVEDWDTLIRNNLTSAFLCSKSALSLMQRNGFGRIINISSVVGQQGALFGHVHYAATKSGMIGFTKTLARTAAPLGVNVNAIAPGIIDTALLKDIHGPERYEELKSSVPLGLGSVRDIGLAAAFLSGEGGRYITGATLDVNGGLYLR